jgi:hypothetical protein
MRPSLLSSFETPGFAPLCRAPQDEVREFEPIGFLESIVQHRSFILMVRRRFFSALSNHKAAAILMLRDAPNKLLLGMRSRCRISAQGL